MEKLTNAVLNCAFVIFPLADVRASKRSEKEKSVKSTAALVHGNVDPLPELVNGKPEIVAADASAVTG